MVTLAKNHIKAWQSRAILSSVSWNLRIEAHIFTRYSELVALSLVLLEIFALESMGIFVVVTATSMRLWLYATLLHQ